MAKSFDELGRQVERRAVEGLQLPGEITKGWFITFFMGFYGIFYGIFVGLYTYFLWDFFYQVPFFMGFFLGCLSDFYRIIYLIMEEIWVFYGIVYLIIDGWLMIMWLI